MNQEGDRLYRLLPALYRIRDHAEGEPLRALLAVIEEEVAAVEADIEGLYENWFIETCADWVVPYIGDLVGNRPLYDVGHRRADVAKTLYYRQRKGTLAMLEELARDVTGWGAHAVAFFELLGWTQNLNHLRFTPSADAARRNPTSVDRVGTVNLRSRDVVDRIDGPFDVATHTVDVRRIGQAEGWHNLRNVGFFLWRLRPYPVAGTPPREAEGRPYGYHLGPLRAPAPLFNRPQREADDAALAEEVHIPMPIRPLAFSADLRAYTAQYLAVPADERPPASQYYGPGRSLYIVKDGVPVPPLAILCKNLEDWAQPPSGYVAVDVARGRITLPPDEEDAVLEVDYTYGFSADLGSGPYDRRASLVSLEQATLLIDVAKGTAVDTLQEALDAWVAADRPPCRIRIMDSAVYGGNVDITLPEDGWLAIEAANGERPVVRLVGIASLTVLAAAGATLQLNGLLVEGGFELNGPLHLMLTHCTLVPGRTLDEEGLPVFPDRDSLVVGTPSGEMAVTLRYSIVGPIRLPAEARRLTIEDSIVHAPAVGGSLRPAIAADDAQAAAGPPTTLRRVTVWGPVFVRELTLASEVLFNHVVRAERQQAGCARFSYVPPGSQVPRRYRCQPDLALAARAAELPPDTPLPADERRRIQARLRPEYTSERYGDPAYAQLSLSSVAELREGAEDGSEMGVFHHLQQPHRAANLHRRLEEYLPFGLEAGLLYVT